MIQKIQKSAAGCLLKFRQQLTRLPSSYSWTYKRKWAATAIVSLFTFISPVSSSMIAPASSKVAEEFGITSAVMIAMTTSIFILAYGASDHDLFSVLCSCTSVSFGFSHRPTLFGPAKRDIRSFPHSAMRQFILLGFVSSNRLWARVSS